MASCLTTRKKVIGRSSLFLSFMFPHQTRSSNHVWKSPSNYQSTSSPISLKAIRIIWWKWIGLHLAAHKSKFFCWKSNRIKEDLCYHIARFHYNHINEPIYLLKMQWVLALYNHINWPILSRTPGFITSIFPLLNQDNKQAAQILSGSAPITILNYAFKFRSQIASGINSL